MENHSDIKFNFKLNNTILIILKKIIKFLKRKLVLKN